MAGQLKEISPRRIGHKVKIDRRSLHSATVNLASVKRYEHSTLVSWAASINKTNVTINGQYHGRVTHSR